jgi:hypothetical protein
MGVAGTRLMHFFKVSVQANGIVKTAGGANFLHAVFFEGIVHKFKGFLCSNGIDKG